MVQMREAGITPAIHLYYWGDDISQSCFYDGCWSELHQATKTQGDWDALTGQLVDHVGVSMRGAPVLIILESEFNKADIQDHEPFDAALAEKADFIHQHYPAAQVVLGLGNWNRELWSTWDRAADASDLVGIQAVWASWNAHPAYERVFEETLQGVQEARTLFGKGIVLHDIALSSLPDGRLIQDQAAAIASFASELDELKAAGVQAMIYRSWRDTPNMNTANTFGEAERSWGLARADGTLKEAAQAWALGVLTERGAPPFDAVFAIPDNVNTWWIEVHVTATHGVASVDAIIDDRRVSLQRSDWGAWVHSRHVPPGSTVVFEARNVLGDVVRSDAAAWLQGFSDGFVVAPGANGWWIEVEVARPVQGVTAVVGAESVPLAPTPWGSWAAAKQVPVDAEVRFEARHGGLSWTSAPRTWTA